MRHSAYFLIAILLAGASARAQQSALAAAPSTRASVVVTLNPPRGTPNATPARIRIDHGQPHKRTLSATLESFSIWLIPAQKPGTPTGELRLAWGDTELSTDWNVVLR